MQERTMHERAMHELLREPDDTSAVKAQPVRKCHHKIERPPFECIALVLQGGGALGAFQAGVYQALAEADLVPDWIAGISIGAINAALIAGNPPERRVERLRAFWEEVTTPIIANLPDVVRTFWSGDEARGFFNQVTAWGALMRGAPGFFAPRPIAPFLFPPGTTEATSYYDTGMLRGTLEKLIDFDRINSGEMRFSVGAVNVRTGNFAYFDSTTHDIGPEHVMASGALPPGFPAVEIEGELYWDGGLVSNTPMQWVVSGSGTRQDTIAFQVDLWSARGDAPHDMPGVMMRQKEIQFSSRTRANTDQFKTIQRVRGALANVLEQMPPELRDSEDCRLLRSVADRKVYKIVQLVYRAKHYERQSKDYEFSRISMQDHWQAGYNDAIRTLRHPEALARPTDRSGVSTFDLGVDGRD
jgi:NTE family protein